MKNKLLSLIVLWSMLIGIIPSYAVESKKDTVITVTLTPEKYIYYYRNDYANTGGVKRMLVDTEGSYSAYSTYAFMAYEIPNGDAATQIDFSTYSPNFRSDRSGGALFWEVRDEIPSVAKGIYASDTAEYTEWSNSSSCIYTFGRV